MAPLLQRPLVKAAYLGLVGGLFAGGLMLLGYGARGLFFAPPCPAPDTAQCALEQQVMVSFARRQTLFGGLLALLAVCLFSYFRSRARRDAA